MTTVLNWTKGLFKCSYKILSGDVQIGELKESEFSQSAFGELHGKKFRFKTKGFLTQKTDIIDLENNELIGKITYNCWYPKAKIEYGSNLLYWKFSNLWETKWRIFNDEGVRFDFHGWSMKGEVEMDIEDDLMVLTGLFIGNYYWKMVVIYAAVLPIILFV